MAVNLVAINSEVVRLIEFQGFYQILETKETKEKFKYLHEIDTLIFKEGEIDDFQIGGVLIQYENSTRLIVLGEFAEFSWQNKSIVQNVQEYVLYKDASSWEVVTNPKNKLFERGAIFYNKNTYVSKITGLPVLKTHDENGNLLSSVEPNFDFYFRNLLYPYLLKKQCDYVKMCVI